jgi:hypothetical protein
MPTNQYVCSCGFTWTFIGPYKERECKVCHISVAPQLPANLPAPSVFEIVDKERNVKWRDNFQEKAAKRNAKGSKYGAVERARENGDSVSKHGITDDDPKPI